MFFMTPIGAFLNCSRISPPLLANIYVSVQFSLAIFLAQLIEICCG